MMELAKVKNEILKILAPLMTNMSYMKVKKQENGSL